MIIRKNGAYECPVCKTGVLIWREVQVAIREVRHNNSLHGTVVWRTMPGSFATDEIACTNSNTTCRATWPFNFDSASGTHKQFARCTKENRKS